MMGHKICFYGEILLIIPKLSLLLLLIWSTVFSFLSRDVVVIGCNCLLQFVLLISGQSLFEQTERNKFSETAYGDSRSL